jgi:hypothetical protein
MTAPTEPTRRPPLSKEVIHAILCALEGGERLRQVRERFGTSNNRIRSAARHWGWWERYCARHAPPQVDEGDDGWAPQVGGEE